jgi:hypothetical protein
MELGHQFSPIKKSELPMNLETAQATSREVSPDEFQATAAKGQARLDKMRSKSHDISALSKGLGEVTEHAYGASREEWGGATYNPRTAKPVSFTHPDKHVLSARTAGQEPVTVPADASKEHFSAAMQQAHSTFRDQLAHSSHYLGVFHDADKGQVEIDPVVVVGDSSGKHRQEVGQAKAQEIGAATHAVGGAYHFASGNGVFPPHVAG